VGAARATVDVSVLVEVVVTGIVTREGETVTVMVMRSMYSAVVVGARPR
jgi:hypothetical protein